MKDINEYLIQEKEIGDIVFNTDVTNIYNTNKSINNDKYLNKPDIQTYIFNNNLNTNFFQKENGVVLPIRHQSKLHVDLKNGNGVYIVRYYTIYKESFEYINDIIKFNFIHNNELKEDYVKRISEILQSNNKPLVDKIKLRFITFIPESIILTHGVVQINNTYILKDIDRIYKKGFNGNNKYNYSLNKELSLHVEIEYGDNTDNQMYYKLGDDFVRLKKNKKSQPSINCSSYIGEDLIHMKCSPINESNRNSYGIYTNDDIDKEISLDQSKKIVDNILVTTNKRYELVEDIKKTILNDEQAKLEIQKAIMKLTHEVNNNNIKQSINEYKDIVKGNKTDANLIAEMLKIFKSIV